MAKITDRLSHALPLLNQMVNLDSPSFDKPLVDRFAHFVGDRFKEIGGDVQYVPAAKFGDHLLIRFEGASSDRVLVLGHTDTVFPAGESAKRPFTIADGRAMGPGVFDMKSGILLAWWALSDLLEKGRLTRSVTMLFNSDEEVGSHSSQSLIESEARQASAVLVLEPSLPGGVLKTSRKGVGRFTVKAIGRAAHAGVDPENGVNAIEEIAHQVIQLHAMTDKQRGTSVNVGVIQGGARTNVIPAEAVVDVDVRIASLEEAEQVTRTIRAMTPRLSGATLEVRGGINRPPMERTAATARLFEIAKTVARELDMDLREGATGGASDGNFTAALGIPTLDGLGAVGDFAHGLEEFVDVQSLPARAALIAGLIERV